MRVLQGLGNKMQPEENWKKLKLIYHLKLSLMEPIIIKGFCIVIYVNRDDIEEYRVDVGIVTPTAKVLSKSIICGSHEEQDELKKELLECFTNDPASVFRLKCLN